VVEEDEDDDALSYFAKLAEDWLNLIMGGGLSPPPFFMKLMILYFLF
jgi:hypothetical protein